MNIDTRITKLEDRFIKSAKANYETFTLAEDQGKVYLIEHRLNATVISKPNKKIEWIEPPRKPFTSRVIVTFSTINIFKGQFV